MKLASGTARVIDLHRSGMVVGLKQRCSRDNDLDMFDSDAADGVPAQAGPPGHPRAVAAATALRMTTMDGPDRGWN